MTTGSGDKPNSGSSPGRPAADTPQRLVVRSGDSGETFSGSDTAVAVNPTAAAPERAEKSEPTQELVGATLSGRDTVTRKIGQGGMGAVYEAKHTAIGGRFAVKVLLDKYAKRDAIVARLKQEAQLATSLDHEHIIRVTDFGSPDDGRTFVVMEFLEGESLAELLARETKLPEQRILRMASQAASALAAAHAKGIVHRDIKPENLFIIKRKEQDFVKIVDFGISKNLRASDEQEEQPRLTQTGMVLGTPLYMSPEQARGDEDLDHRVDIYALGVIMYETATGRVPFAGTNCLSVISQVLNGGPPKKKQPVVPPPVTVDAAVIAPPVVVDAPPEPELKKMTIHVVTDPAGATVFKESEELGPAPRDFLLVKKDKDIKISATFAGGYYGEVTINPVEEPGDKKTVTLKLKKQAVPVNVHPKTGTGTGSAAQTPKSNGELGPNPYLHNKCAGECVPE